MQNSIRVVVTGIGVVSPIGIGRKTFADSLSSGCSGITRWDVTTKGLPGSFLIAPIKGFEGKEYIQPRKAMKLMSRELQTAYAASMLAFQDAQIDRSTLDADRMGTVFGSELLYGELDDYADAVKKSVAEGEFSSQTWGAEGMRLMNPLWMLKYLPNMAACHVGIAIDARGPNNTITSEEVSGLLALIEAANVIRRGVADVMLVGATGNRINQTRLLYRRHEKISCDLAAPATALRPFDQTHNGTVEGEGAVTLVIESEAHAQRRGATPIAELVGWGSSCCRPTRPYGMNRQAIVNSLQAALATAGVTAKSLDHINAHGSGVPHEDREEAQALAAVAPGIPVTSLKAHFGSLGSSAALMELAGSLCGIAKGEVFPTLNHHQTDPGCPVDVICQKPKSWSENLFAKTSFTCTGQAASVIMKRF